MYLIALQFPFSIKLSAKFRFLFWLTKLPVALSVLHHLLRYVCVCVVYQTSILKFCEAGRCKAVESAKPSSTFLSQTTLFNVLPHKHQQSNPSTEHLVKCFFV